MNRIQFFLARLCAYLVGIVCLAYSVQAQDKPIPFEDEEAFAVSTVPDKWADESAIVVSRKNKYFYDKKASKYKEINRTRIKLQDKAAVKNFSVFYFLDNYGYNDGGSYARYVIYKADGTQQEVPVTDAVKTSARVPSYYQSYNSGLYTYKKLAIPGLEPGDIIDYCYQYSGFNADALDPIIFTLALSYPSIKQSIEFEVEKGYFINFNTYNGAPKLKTLDNPKRKSYSFLMEDFDREKEEDERWHYAYRSTPTVKFQVVNVESKGLKFLSQDYNTPTEVVSEGQIRREASDYIRKHSIKALKARNFVEFAIMEGCFGKVDQTISDEVYAAKAYLAIRQGFYSFPVRERLTSTSYRNGYRTDEVKGISDAEFVVLMRYLLAKRKIESEIIIGVSRRLGTIDDILLPQELSWAIRLKRQPNQVFFPPDENTHQNDRLYYLEGTEVYVLSPDDEQKPPFSISRETISSSKAADNVDLAKVKLNFKPGLQEMSIDRKTIATNHLKTSHFEKAFIYSMYHDKCFNGKKSTWESKEIVQKRTKEEDSLRNEYVESRIEREFDLVSFESFELEQDGRDHQKPELIYSEKFTVKELTRKAGPYYIFNIGELIGGQVEIKDKDLERKYDIYMPYPRTFSYRLEVAIPDGWKVAGLDRLNMNVSNACGSFISAAKEENGKVFVTVDKVYSGNYFPKEDWPKIVAFLNEAYKFTQERILLKPIGN